MARRKKNEASSATEPVRKSRSLKPLGMLAPYLGRYRFQVGAALVALIAATLATLAMPLAVRRMIDFGFGGGDPNFIDKYFAMLVVVVAALACASAARYYFVTWLGERIVSDLRVDVFAHITRLSASFFDTARSGEVVSRLTADTTQVKAAVGASVSVALRNLALFIGAAAMMVITSPRLSGLVLLVIPFVVIPLIVFGRMVRRRSRLAQDTLADASAYAVEAIGAIRTLQAFTNERFAASRFGAQVERAFAAARSSFIARAILTAFGMFVIFASVVAVIWIGSKDELSGMLSGGALGQFVLYLVFTAGALGQLSEVWGELAQAAGASERLAELFRIEPEIRAPKEPKALPKPSRGAIRFDHVSFAYPSLGDERVVDGIDIDIHSGETVAVVGPSGAGKSTLFHLLMRFYNPQAGYVSLDGIDLRDADPEELRHRIALVPQDSVIFGTTVKENLLYGRPDASDEDIRAAAIAAHADTFISAMGNGYDTMIGERGVTLSGGERQRLAIARALLKDAPVLLLDEATSALDAESETLVQIVLDRLMKDRTTLVIAHRLATVLKADRILVMDNGRIVEQGDHETLVAQGGLYTRLARLQFERGAQGFEAAK
ncbi:ABC transporter transmembrane domain-containing protein [Breoghania sp.]|uniref:ABC transporter transmembrane domain-containing protein n=1 Tax=Breoghania sp. TaxID=2065378 RepID=UPI002618598A|nr:ABC transporter transmembrane domain-containing protein [Breoghania sp.]MDJ0932423.1 ABC transporter transmembrane domain-containing protein [Breoghania sp.]